MFSKLGRGITLVATLVRAQGLASCEARARVYLATGTNVRWYVVGHRVVICLFLLRLPPISSNFGVYTLV